MGRRERHELGPPSQVATAAGTWVEHPCEREQVARTIFVTDVAPKRLIRDGLSLAPGGMAPCCHGCGSLVACSCRVGLVSRSGPLLCHECGFKVAHP